MKQEALKDQGSKIRDAKTTWSRLDDLDAQILEALSILGPRNLKEVAAKLGIPATTLRYRVKRMVSESILFFHLNPYHTNIGLKKVTVFAEANQGYEDDLLKCLTAHDYWIFLFRIYGPFEGVGGVFTIPRDSASQFENYLRSLKAQGLAQSIEAVWSTCFQGVPVTMKWYDHADSSWKFHWDEWIDEVTSIQGELPYTLAEPSDWPLKADREDLLILKELEKNGAVNLSDIARTLKMNLARLKYHYYEHILKNGVIEGYQVEIYRNPFPVSEMLFFKFGFSNPESMSKFALSLLDKPFGIFMGKVLGENSLLLQAYLPKQEFRAFVAALSTLIKKGLLKNYHYYIQDMCQTWRETIPYEHFKQGRWEYDAPRYNQDIDNVAASGDKASN